jgi:hypothetical protein
LRPPAGTPEVAKIMNRARFEKTSISRPEY